jgi:hypothetical protein
MPVTVDDTTLLPERTKEPSTHNAQPYVDAIDLIRVAIKRHREYNDSLEDSRETSHNIVEDSHRSQSPIGYTNDAQTIEDIEKILQDLDRTHPPPKLSHDSSKIDEDLVSTADDNGRIVAPLVSLIPSSSATHSILLSVLMTVLRLSSHDPFFSSCNFRESGSYRAIASH